MNRVVHWAGVGVLAWAAACSDDRAQSGGGLGSGAGGTGGTGTSGSLNVDTGSTGSGTTSGTTTSEPGVPVEGGVGAEGGVTTGTVVGSGETECNGVDDDGNGIVDDVDMGGDGVCDCLRIGTLGTAANVGPGDVFADWLDERSTYGATQLDSITAESLADLQVLVLQNLQSYAPTQAEVSALEEWLHAGGGVIALNGYAILQDALNANVLMEPTGLTFGTSWILLGATTLPVEEWQPHPVSEGIEKVGFNNGYEVLGAGTILAERDGYVVMRANTVGEGRALAWGDEWVTINSEWDSQPDFDTERFWLNVLKWLSPPTECQVPVALL